MLQNNFHVGLTEAQIIPLFSAWNEEPCITSVMIIVLYKAVWASVHFLLVCSEMSRG